MPTPTKKRRIWPWIVLTVGGLAVMAAVAVAALLVEPMLRRHAIDTARDHGVVLVPGELDWGIGWVRLTNSKARLQGVRGIEADVQRIEVSLSGLSLRRIELSGVDVRVEGSAALLAVELGEWSKDHPRTYRLPVSASDVDVTWQSQKGAGTWLAIDDGQVTPKGAGGSFSAKHVDVAGMKLGQVGASWTAESSSVALGFGKTTLDDAPIRVEIEHALPEPRARVTLIPTEAKLLSGPLGVELPLEDVQVGGEALMVFERGPTDGAIDGVLSIRLDGYVPPHPPELDGFVFGKTTWVSTKFRVNEDRTRVTLSETRVRAGSFQLEGQGVALREADHARIQMALKGNLPCTSLASAAAESRLGKTIGRWLGAAARQTMQGSVGVTVKIDADTRNLKRAKVARIIGIGCGLKPLNIPGFGEVDLDLPGLRDWVEGAPELPKDLPKLPDMPSSLPPIPTFKAPEFPFPTRREGAANGRDGDP